MSDEEMKDEVTTPVEPMPEETTPEAPEMEPAPETHA